MVASDQNNSANGSQRPSSSCSALWLTGRQESLPLPRVSPPNPSEYYDKIYFVWCCAFNFSSQINTHQLLVTGCDPIGPFKKPAAFQKPMCETTAHILDNGFFICPQFCCHIVFSYWSPDCSWHRWQHKSHEIDGSEDIYVRRKVQSINILAEEKCRGERKYALCSFYPGYVCIFFHASMLESKSPHCCP